MTRLFQITAPHFVAGLEVRGQKVVRAAPILGWTVGRSLGRVAAYCREKNWSIVAVEAENMTEIGMHDPE